MDAHVCSYRIVVPLFQVRERRRCVGSRLIDSPNRSRRFSTPPFPAKCTRMMKRVVRSTSATNLRSLPPAGPGSSPCPGSARSGAPSSRRCRPPLPPLRSETVGSTADPGFRAQTELDRQPQERRASAPSRGTPTRCPRDCFTSLKTKSALVVCPQYYREVRPFIAALFTRQYHAKNNSAPPATINCKVADKNVTGRTLKAATTNT